VIKNCILGLLLFGLISHNACKKIQIDEPEIILDDSLLVNILTDSYILNSAFNQTYGIVKDSIGKVYSQQILDRYHISRELLDANVNWLYQDQGRVDSLFQRMLDRLDYLEERVTGENLKNERAR
jgi:hypothetical protein